MSGCRDCSRCTELALVSLVMVPFRLAWWLLTFWNVGLLRRKCPHCSHRLALHSRLADGRFRD
jgi:ribosomal protein S27AE